MIKEQQEHISTSYFEMSKLLLSIAYRSLESYSLAEEAIQDAFCIACRKPDSFLSSGNPQGWIVNTLLNVIRNMKRTISKNTQNVINAPALFPAIPHYDDYSDIEYADLVGSEEYNLNRKVAVEQYSVKDAADALSVSNEACKKRIHRIRAKLKRNLRTVSNGLYVDGCIQGGLC